MRDIRHTKRTNRLSLTHISYFDFDHHKDLCLLVCLFCLNGSLPEGSGYPIRDFAAHPGTLQTFLLP